MHVRAFDRNMHLAGVFCVHRRVEGVKIAHSLWFLIIGVVGTVATAVTYALLVINALHGIGGIMGGNSI